MRARLRACVREVVAAFAAFCLLFNISFIAAPSISTGRVAVLVLLAWGGRPLWRRLYAEIRRQGIWMCWYAGLVVYSTALWISSGLADPTQTSRLVNFGVFVFLAPVIVVTLLTPTMDRALRALVGATLAQAFFIAVAYVSPEFRDFTAAVLVQGGNIPLTFGGQVAGFSNSAGAALSVSQSLGVFAAMFLTRRSGRPLHVVLLLVVALVIAGSTIVVGRTGVLLSALYMVVAMLTTARPQQIVALIVGATMAGGTAYAMRDQILATAEEYNPAVAATLAWSIGVFERLVDDPSVVELRQTPVPPLSLVTVLGTGLVTAGGVNASGHDSGYIQTYYALGLGAAAAFYGGFLLLVLKTIARRGNRALLLAFVVSLCAIEVKEPFLFKYSAPMALILVLLASRADSRPQVPGPRRLLP